MHRLASTARPLLSLIASGTPRWWPSAAANPPIRRVSRSPHGSRNMASISGAKGEEVIDDRKPGTPGETLDITGCEPSSAAKESSAAAEIPDYPVDDVPLIYILPDSSHRDGSIYRGTEDWKRSYSVADRDEKAGDI